MSHRVRTLIPHLSYAELTKLNILPKAKLFTQKTVQSLGGKTICPTLSKKLGPSSYGLFLETVIECMLSNINIATLKLTLPTDIQQYFNPDAFADLHKLIKTEFINKNIYLQPQVEIKYKNIEGHPDFVSIDTIYDVKTTGQFGKMRVETIFQLLSYYCLSQLNNMDIKYIGLILPLQLQVIKVDVSTWDWKPFYQHLLTTIPLKHDKQSLWSLTLPQQVAFQLLFKQYVGSHIHKNDLSKYLHAMPAAQFFLNGNQTSSVAYKPEFLTELKNIIVKTKKPVYIHAPYALNMSQPGKKKEERSEDEDIEKSLSVNAWGGWTFYCLKKLLKFGQKAGVKGVVVHCGKTCKGDYDKAVQTMRDAVIACSVYATPECPIIIETCAHQNGEILADPEELSLFYNYLPDFVRSVVRICVDSCHVQSAGFQPMDFINILHKNKVPICLVHYNDSKVQLGAKKDRHACIGHGYIGYDQLNQVMLYCITNNIPMVTE